VAGLHVEYATSDGRRLQDAKLSVSRPGVNWGKGGAGPDKLRKAVDRWSGRTGVRPGDKVLQIQTLLRPDKNYVLAEKPRGKFAAGLDLLTGSHDHAAVMRTNIKVSVW
jgi:hypothetical protein